MRKIIQRGAEAVLWLEGDRLVKERIKKGYRITQIDDRVRKSRTKAEIKLLERASFAGVAVPKVLAKEDYSITMEFIQGRKLKEILNKMESQERVRVCGEAGMMAATIHSFGMVHGDLTTSNMIINKEGKLFLIDFGLGKFSNKTEDRAVDLFLLYEALKSTHFPVLEECWDAVVSGYKRSARESEAVLRRLEKIRKRRRYAEG